MKITYFQDGENIIGVTDDSPAGFRNVLYVGRGPDASGKIIEQLYEVNRLRKLQQIKPSAAIINAIGLETVTVEELPVFDAEGENLLDLMPVRRRSIRPEYVTVSPEQYRHNKMVMIAGGIAGAIVTLILKFCL